MKINVTEEAANWYKEELNLTDKSSLRFFVRYGGVGGRIAGFSLGVKLESPINAHASTTVDDIQFFVEESDAWYFEDSNLSVSFDTKNGEPKIEYPEA
ncbi:HesB/YadR/YfhF family protein [Oceanobacillus sp. 1P07AA]|uniref:HesB/YadR/YfhF family protein n=1 Tax=Oceanobacillus sp. 1P07AA TaxID=3132293 RepID=UPI0039A4425A